MEKLSYQLLEKTGCKNYILKSAPEKVMQFGEGNFLRAFVDYFFDVSNEKAGWNGKCVLIQPIPQGLTKEINAQDGLYTLYLRGAENGEKIDRKRIISSVSRAINPYEEQGFLDMMALAESPDLEFVASNTTEAGIRFDPACKMNDRPASSFPGKLTQVLFHRFEKKQKGLVILSCELIDNNGKELEKCVDQYVTLWNLGEDFRNYIHRDCIFCSTLVDRIVPGRVKDENERKKMTEENGYQDDLMDVGEVFGVWNIEGPDKLTDMLPFKKANLNVHVVKDVTPYKKRKVRILNGAHTGTVLGAYLAGYNIVRDCMYDENVSAFMNKMIYEEIIPTLPLDKKDLDSFAKAVEDRFKNPFVDHALLSISLNSTSKWRARILPTLLDYVEKEGKLPPCLTMSLASYIAFYSLDIQSLSDEGLVCRRPNGDSYTCQDDRWVLEFYHDHKNCSEKTLVHHVLTCEKMWGMDLSRIPGLEEATVLNLCKIRQEGAMAAYAHCVKE